jgi:hypothetical protein
MMALILHATMITQNSYAQRPGLADGGELVVRPPGTAAWLFDKVKY